MKHIVFPAFSTLFVMLLLSCSPQLAGNSSEITNGYCVASAAPADSAMVVAYPDNYIPYPPSSAPETTYTDKNGHFSLQLGRTGWNLVIYDKYQTRGAFVPLPAGDSALDTIALAEVGAVRGTVTDTMAGDRCIGVIGSPFYARITGKTDTFSLVKMPSFNYLINLWRLTAGVSQWGPPDMNTTAVRPISVTVRPDSTATIIIQP
jgi:hypothetical protein